MTEENKELTAKIILIEAEFETALGSVSTADRYHDKRRKATERQPEIHPIIDAHHENDKEKPKAEVGNGKKKSPLRFFSWFKHKEQSKAENGNRRRKPQPYKLYF